MAVTTTTRLGLTRWGADTDPQNRTQFVNNVDQIEARAAIFLHGTLAARPAYGAAGKFYYITSGSGAGQMWYDTGTAWVLLAQLVATDNTASMQWVKTSALTLQSGSYCHLYSSGATGGITQVHMRLISGSIDSSNYRNYVTGLPAPYDLYDALPFTWRTMGTGIYRHGRLVYESGAWWPLFDSENVALGNTFAVGNSDIIVAHGSYRTA